MNYRTFLVKGIAVCMLPLAVSGLDAQVPTVEDRLTSWENEIERLYVHRNVRFATDLLEFERKIAQLEVTSALLSDVANREMVKNALIDRMRAGRASAPEAQKFYGHLFCRLVGVNSSKLLRACNVYEGGLNGLLLVLFSDDGVDRLEGIRGENLRGFRTSESPPSGDPFASPSTK